MKGTAAAAEHAIALDLALDKVEQQMRRLHERRVGAGTAHGRDARVDGAANGATASTAIDDLDGLDAPTSTTTPVRRS